MSSLEYLNAVQPKKCGTDVKRARKHALIQEYELFRMQQGETIADVQKRFTHIVNHLIGLGK